jgi:AraC-like DNA-binding protein
MITQLWLPIPGSPRPVGVELVDVRRDNHDIESWKNGYGPAIKESFYFTLIAEATSRIKGPGWEYELKPGDGLFVMPGEEIQAKFSAGQFLRSYNLHFNLIDATSEEALSVFPRTVGRVDDSGKLRDSLDCLIDAALRHDESLTICEFSSFLLELAKIPLRRSQRNLSPLVASALDLIHGTIDGHQTRELIAARLSVTPNHLSSSIKAETGRTITSHLQEAKIRVAKDLMYAMRLNVSEVADRLEMDIHSFSRLFKAVIGKSPGQYRKETMTGLPHLTPSALPESSTRHSSNHH